MKNYPSFVSDSLLYSLFLSLFFLSFSLSLSLSLSRWWRSPSKEGIDGFLNIHRVLKPRCRIFNRPPRFIRSGKNWFFPFGWTFASRITRCREREDDLCRDLDSTRASSSPSTLQGGRGGVLRVVKKESVAKFRISWRGGTDVTIRSLPRLVFRRSSHKC